MCLWGWKMLDFFFTIITISKPNKQTNNYTWYLCLLSRLYVRLCCYTLLLVDGILMRQYKLYQRAIKETFWISPELYLMKLKCTFDAVNVIIIWFSIYWVLYLPIIIHRRFADLMKNEIKFMVTMSWRGSSSLLSF